MAEQEESLRERQPWKAAYTKDYAWLGDVVTKHYHGDDSDVKVLVAGILKSFEGMPVEDYEAAAASFLDQAPHPTLKRRLRDCIYEPMIELLRHLEAHGFVNYIASAAIATSCASLPSEIYGIPAERVVGSSNALGYVEDGDCGSVAYLAKPDVFDDGPAKPVRIWSRIGRVRRSHGNPALRLLLLHDDAARHLRGERGVRPRRRGPPTEPLPR